MTVQLRSLKTFSAKSINKASDVEQVDDLVESGINFLTLRFATTHD